MALEVLQHQAGLDYPFLHANQETLSLLYFLVFQEVLGDQGVPWDQVDRYRVPHFLLLLCLLFFLGDPFFPFLPLVQGTQGDNTSHLIQGDPVVLVLQAGPVVLASQVVLGHSRVFQAHPLPLEILEDQEPLVAHEVPSCLDNFPLVCLGALEDLVIQHLQSLHSGQGALGPLEHL